MNIIISGASRGIGAALAQIFDYRENSIALLSSSANLQYIPKNAKYLNLKVDLSDLSQIAPIYSEIKNKFGNIDLLINNAGIGIFKDFCDFSDEDFQCQINANMNHVFKLSQLAIHDYKEKKQGIIININSVSSIKTFKYSSVYAASKAGILAMSRSTREETREFGIKIIDVILGATNTDIWDKKMRKEFEHRFLKPIDVASAIKNIFDTCLNNNVYFEELTIKPQLGDL